MAVVYFPSCGCAEECHKDATYCVSCNEPINAVAEVEA